MFNVNLGGEKIYFMKENFNSVKNAKELVSDFIIEENFNVSDEVKQAFKTLQTLTNEYNTSICNVCGDRQNTKTHMNIEHVKFKVSWGYESNHDCETHELVLCNKCYDEHILGASLGKFVKITRNY